GGSGGPGCTLRDAIAAAEQDAPVGGCPAGEGADVIVLAAGLTVLLSEVDNETDGPNGLPAIGTEVVVRGQGSVVARAPGSPISAAPAGRAARCATPSPPPSRTLPSAAAPPGRARTSSSWPRACRCSRATATTRPTARTGCLRSAPRSSCRAGAPWSRARPARRRSGCSTCGRAGT